VSALRRTEDPDVSCAIARAYNDWLSEYCSFAPDRLFGMALIPPTNAVDASKEARRIAGFPGIRGLQLLAFPDGEATATLGDEPFWEEVDELGIAVVAHHNWGGEERGKSHVLPGQKEKILKVGGDVDLSYFAYLLSGDMPIPTIPIITIEELFLAGVLDRHPTLRFHFAETGIGWLPYWLEQMDDRYERHRHWAGVELARRPSEYVRDQFTFSFQEDHAGIAARHAIGVDNICWASDFPHAVGDWPYSRETRERQLKDVPDDERRKIEGLNIAAQLRVITAEQKHDESLLPRDEVPPSPLLERGERQLTRTSST
jgi:predicted TIM-barrel fold metal-dependent hydrolase